MIFDKLVKLIAEQFGVDEETITRETSFANDLNADSLDLVELMMSLEEEFDLGEVEDDSVERLATVADVEDFIRERTEQ